MLLHVGIGESILQFASQTFMATVKRHSSRAIRYSRVYIRFMFVHEKGRAGGTKMESMAETFYWDEADRKDQEARRQVNAGGIYTDDARCDLCGARLNGYTFECEVCKILLCPLHSCVDGRCPEDTGSGEHTVNKD